MDAADAQARLGRAAYRADLAAQALQADVQTPDLFIQQRGFGRAVHALAHALEQAHLDAGLQRGQVALTVAGDRSSRRAAAVTLSVS